LVTNDAVLRFDAVGFEIGVAEIYAGVDFGGGVASR